MFILGDIFFKVELPFNSFVYVAVHISANDGP